jgi:hypothetical protein
LLADVLYANEGNRNFFTEANILLKGNYGDDYSFELKDDTFATFGDSKNVKRITKYVYLLNFVFVSFISLLLDLGNYSLNMIFIISLLMSPLLGHRPSLLIHKERAITHNTGPVQIDEC